MAATPTSHPSYFRCMGRNYSCTVNSPLDPDIAGVGVIVAFLTTALITFAAILVGYVAKCLPGVSTNDLDEHYVNKVQKLFGLQPTPDSNDEVRLKTKHKREEALERFVLTLSDQQLVTGLSVLIAAFVKCDISVYSFGIVTAVGWFSCMTHLSTLIVLKRYLLDYPLVLKIRVWGMLLIAVLLLAAEVISYLSIAQPNLKNMAMYCSLRPRSSYLATILIYLLPIITWLVAAYVNRLAAVSVKTRADPLRSWVYHYAILKADANFVPPVPVDRRARAIDKIRAANDQPSRLKKSILNLFELVRFAYAELISSFLWELIWLLFGLVYAISQLGNTWRKFESPNKSSLFVMGFGQMVPIILLVLPVLAALEVYQEVKERPKLPHGSDDGTSNTNAENAPPEVAQPPPTKIQAAPNLEAPEICASIVDPGGSSEAERPVLVQQETSASHDNTTVDFDANEIFSESVAEISSASGPLPNPQTEGPSGAVKRSRTVNSAEFSVANGAPPTEYQYPIRATTIELSQIEEGSTRPQAGVNPVNSSSAHDLRTPNQQGQSVMLNLHSYLQSNGDNFYMIPLFRYVLASMIALHVLLLIYFAINFSGTFINGLPPEGVGALSGYALLLIPLSMLSPRLGSVLLEIKDVHYVWRARTAH